MNQSQDREGTILIVDDEPNNVQVVGSMLAAFGYDFMIANDGEQALKRVEAKIPDLVLLDIHLPGLDGFEVCSAFREIEGMEEIPVIFLSADNEKNTIVKALECGGVDYVTKPFNKAELLARVRTHLELKAIRDERAELLAKTERFLEIMAHDLKNWVGSANFSARLLGDLNDLPEKGVKVANNITDSTDQALAFIEEFLTNAREARTEMLLDAQTFSLDLLIEELVKQVEPAAREKNISVELSGLNEEIQVEMDRTALRRVLENLLSNAIKFSSSGGSVYLVVEQRVPLRLRIADSGQGFSAEDREVLFTPYQRLSARPTGGEVSTGLGLSIVKKLCDRLEIEIELAETEPGATWVLTFPG